MKYFFGLVSLTIVAIVACMLFMLVDRAFISFRPTTGTVTGHDYDPPTTIWHSTGKNGGWLQHIPERFNLLVHTTDGDGVCEVPESIYISAKHGQGLDLEIAKRRFSSGHSFRNATLKP